MEINGVTTKAPIFNGADKDALLGIVKNLTKASYHYADDSGGEWGHGRKAVQDAARSCNALKLSFGAMEHLYNHESQLVSLRDLIDAVLKDARSSQHPQERKGVE
mgnify:CR=1 FL=1